MAFMAAQSNIATAEAERREGSDAWIAVERSVQTARRHGRDSRRWPLCGACVAPPHRPQPAPRRACRHVQETVRGHRPPCRPSRSATSGVGGVADARRHRAAAGRRPSPTPAPAVERRGARARRRAACRRISSIRGAELRPGAGAGRRRAAERRAVGPSQRATFRWRSTMSSASRCCSAAARRCTAPTRSAARSTSSRARPAPRFQPTSRRAARSRRGRRRRSASRAAPRRTA